MEESSRLPRSLFKWYETREMWRKKKFGGKPKFCSRILCLKCLCTATCILPALGAGVGGGGS